MNWKHFYGAFRNIHRWQMKVWQKWLLVVFFVSGLITLSISQYSTNREVQTTTENGKEYEIYAPYVGDTITRYYEVGEKLSLRLTPKASTSDVPDLLPLNFTIIAPGGNETIFLYWLTPYSDPSSLFPNLIVTDLTTLRIEKLVLDNSTMPKFVGVVTENGNYTLMFTSSSPYVALDYLAFSKIASEEEYLYTFMMPFGIGFLSIGAILTLWIVKGPQKKHRQKGKRRT